ncbi:hypothetical protein ACHAW5_009733 [Stephanodiscus triporus]|uniref:Fatty acid hydroxylase domain-containing protein n=1 Tax=Stephanodiscus triporus TaxID=2934178 RepID=A0ABD3QQJ1_9STRA
MTRSRSISLATAAAASSLIPTACHRGAEAFSAGVANNPIRTRRGTISTPSRSCTSTSSTRLSLSSTTAVAAPASSMARMEADAEDENHHKEKLSVVSDDIDYDYEYDDDVAATNDVGNAVRAVGAAGGGRGGDPSPRRRVVVAGEGRVGESVPSTWREALRRFFVGDNAGPPLAILSISAFVCARVHLLTTTPYSLAEFAIFASSMVVWWVQEYLFHRVLLHSSTFEWIGKSIHRAHHERDYFHVSIDHPILLLGWLLVAHLVIRSMMPWHACLSATVGYALAGLMYEWCHYIVHTKVRPPSSSSSSSMSSFALAFASKAFLRMRNNHIRHHRLDERYWYAFSVPAMDDLFGTNPDVKDL